MPEPLDIALIHGDDLAKAMGYEGVTNAFRDWCATMRITPVPGRRGWYDRKLVRRRLDEAQGLFAAPTDPGDERPMSLVEQRRLRRGAAA